MTWWTCQCGWAVNRSNWTRCARCGDEYGAIGNQLCGDSNNPPAEVFTHKAKKEKYLQGVEDFSVANRATWTSQSFILKAREMCEYGEGDPFKHVGQLEEYTEACRRLGLDPALVLGFGANPRFHDQRRDRHRANEKARKDRKQSQASQYDWTQEEWDQYEADQKIAKQRRQEKVVGKPSNRAAASRAKGTGKRPTVGRLRSTPSPSPRGWTSSACTTKQSFTRSRLGIPLLSRISSKESPKRSGPT